MPAAYPRQPTAEPFGTDISAGLLLQAGRAARERAFQLALVDMLDYLDSDEGQVAILDATNSTQERRDKVGGQQLLPVSHWRHMFCYQQAYVCSRCSDTCSHCVHHSDLGSLKVADMGREPGQVAQLYVCTALLLQWMTQCGGEGLAWRAWQSLVVFLPLVQVIEALLGRVQFIFIENICNDPEILKQNYFNKMLYSPDYKGVPTEQVRSKLTKQILPMAAACTHHAPAQH